MQLSEPPQLPSPISRDEVPQRLTPPPPMMHHHMMMMRPPQPFVRYLMPHELLEQQANHPTEPMPLDKDFEIPFVHFQVGPSQAQIFTSYQEQLDLIEV